jgi:hypothetical protein
LTVELSDNRRGFEAPLNSCSETCDQAPCGAEYDWQTLTVDEEIRITQTTTRLSARAFLDEAVGYRIFVKQVVGDVDIAVKFTPFSLGPISFGSEVGAADNYYWTGYQRTAKEGAEFCPEDTYYSLGTVYIQLSCFEPTLCLYDLILQKLPAPEGTRGGVRFLIF